MVPDPLRLAVLTPMGTLLDADEVAWVQARLADGGTIGIYPGHAPLLAETVAAVLRYADPAGEHALELEAGVLHVDGGGVTVLIGGLAQSGEAVQADESARFDRLARELLTTLEAHADGVLDVSDEG